MLVLGVAVDGAVVVVVVGLGAVVEVVVVGLGDAVALGVLVLVGAGVADEVTVGSFDAVPDGVAVAPEAPDGTTELAASVVAGAGSAHATALTGVSMGAATIAMLATKAAADRRGVLPHERREREPRDTGRQPVIVHVLTSRGQGSRPQPENAPPAFTDFPG